MAIVVRAEHGGGVRQWGHWRPIVTIQRLPSIYLHERQQAHRHNGKVTTRKNHSVSSCENSSRTPMLFAATIARGRPRELELEAKCDKEPSGDIYGSTSFGFSFCRPARHILARQPRSLQPHYSLRLEKYWVVTAVMGAHARSRGVLCLVIPTVRTGQRQVVLGVVVWYTCRPCTGVVINTPPRWE